ncbi:hypothetical protein NDI44_00220 [Trichocoleus sp. DQ-A3]|uniref:hypothetical protein n=1 Tax=Cyanophyceae TaxID=3028117 RepID=UPI0016820BD6|nr:hypothetical protein [Coleofasciculus sp. FACHB-125]MBD1898396.1 hypothetical protein [Coleofasciculus sp. FACHB-125]
MRASRNHNSRLWSRTIGVACCAIFERSLEPVEFGLRISDRSFILRHYLSTSGNNMGRQ